MVTPGSYRMWNRLPGAEGRPSHSQRLFPPALPGARTVLASPAYTRGRIKRRALAPAPVISRRLSLKLLLAHSLKRPLKRQLGHPPAGASVPALL